MISEAERVVDREVAIWIVSHPPQPNVGEHRAWSNGYRAGGERALRTVRRRIRENESARRWKGANKPLSSWVTILWMAIRMIVLISCRRLSFHIPEGCYSPRWGPSWHFTWLSNGSFWSWFQLAFAGYRFRVSVTTFDRKLDVRFVILRDRTVSEDSMLFMTFGIRTQTCLIAGVSRWQEGRGLR